MSLAQAIEAAQAANLQKLSAQIAAPRIVLDDKEQSRVKFFAQWCKDRGVQALPVAPVVLATWIRSEIDAGVDRKEILKAVEAISKLHDAYSMAAPAATTVCRVELARVIDAPRWKAEEKHLWAALPAEVRFVVADRWKRDSNLIRKLQDENAQLYKFAYCELTSINQKEGIENGTSDQKGT